MDLYLRATPANRSSLLFCQFQTTTEATKVKTNAPPKSTRPPTKPPSKQQPVAQHKETPVQHECQGDCVNGLIALFCDDVDVDAYCPSEGTCCITSDEKYPTTTPKVTTPVRLERNLT